MIKSGYATNHLALTCDVIGDGAAIKPALPLFITQMIPFGQCAGNSGCGGPVFTGVHKPHKFVSAYAAGRRLMADGTTDRPDRE